MVKIGIKRLVIGSIFFALFFLLLVNLPPTITSNELLYRMIWAAFFIALISGGVYVAR